MGTDRYTDEGKGRVKEAAGALTDDPGLKREGKLDRGKASAKEGIDKAGKKAQEASDRVSDALSDKKH